MSSLQLIFEQQPDHRRLLKHNERRIHMEYAKTFGELEDWLFENYHVFIPTHILQGLCDRMGRIGYGKFNLAEFEKKFDRESRDLERELFEFNKKQAKIKTLFEELGIK